MSLGNNPKKDVETIKTELETHGNKVTFGEMSAPTAEHVYKSQKLADRAALYELSRAYFMQASLPEILDRYFDDVEIHGFNYFLTIKKDPGVIMRLFHLIWEQNPMLAERYDGFRLVSKEWEGEKGDLPWISFSYIEPHFNLYIRHRDVTDKIWVDVFSLFKTGKVGFRLTKDLKDNVLMDENRSLIIQDVYDPDKDLKFVAEKTQDILQKIMLESKRA